MSYLRYLCLLMHSGVQHMLCCVVSFLRLVYPILTVFSGLSIYACPFGIVRYYIVELVLVLKINKIFISGN